MSDISREVVLIKPQEKSTSYGISQKFRLRFYFHFPSLTPLSPICNHWLHGT